MPASNKRTLKVGFLFLLYQGFYLCITTLFRKGWSESINEILFETET